MGCDHQGGAPLGVARFDVEAVHKQSGALRLVAFDGKVEGVAPFVIRFGKVAMGQKQGAAFGAAACGGLHQRVLASLVQGVGVAGGKKQADACWAFPVGCDCEGRAAVLCGCGRVAQGKDLAKASVGSGVGGLDDGACAFVVLGQERVGSVGDGLPCGGGVVQRDGPGEPGLELALRRVGDRLFGHGLISG